MAEFGVHQWGCLGLWLACPDRHFGCGPLLEEDERICVVPCLWATESRTLPILFNTIKNLTTEEVKDHKIVFQHTPLQHTCCKTSLGPFFLLSYPQRVPLQLGLLLAWALKTGGSQTGLVISKFITSTKPHTGWYFGLAVTRLCISNQPADEKGVRDVNHRRRRTVEQDHPVLGKSYKVKQVADYYIQKNYHY